MEMTAAVTSSETESNPTRTVRERLNAEWHERALQVFMLVVLGHWAEHLAQAYQIYGLGWPAPQARGVLGLLYPWLIKSEVLHYCYALVMLVGIWLLRPGSPAPRGRGGTSPSSSSSGTTSSTRCCRGRPSSATTC